MGCALINGEGWGPGEDILLYVGMASAAEDTIGHAGEDNSVSSKIVFRGALVKICLHIRLSQNNGNNGRSAHTIVPCRRVVQT